MGGLITRRQASIDRSADRQDRSRLTAFDPENPGAWAHPQSLHRLTGTPRPEIENELAGMLDTARDGRVRPIESAGLHTHPGWDRHPGHLGRRVFAAVEINARGSCGTRGDGGTAPPMRLLMTSGSSVATGACGIGGGTDGLDEGFASTSERRTFAARSRALGIALADSIESGRFGPVPFGFGVGRDTLGADGVKAGPVVGRCKPPPDKAPGTCDARCAVSCASANAGSEPPRGGSRVVLSAGGIEGGGVRRRSHAAMVAGAGVES